MSILRKIRKTWKSWQKSKPYEYQYNYSRGGTSSPRILTDDIESNPITPDNDFNFENYSKAIALSQSLSQNFP